MPTTYRLTVVHGLALTSAGRRVGATVLRVTVDHRSLAELDMAADRVGHHRSHAGICVLELTRTILLINVIIASSSRFERVILGIRLDIFIAH